MGRHVGILSLVFFALTSCTTLDPGTTRVIGHAGMGVDHVLAPNGRESLLAALSLGIDGVELDVQLTADNVLVAFHDEGLETSTSCTGMVHAMSWNELSRCATAGNGAEFASIARVDSLLLEAAARYPTADFTLDCKLFAHGDWWSYLEAYTDALATLEHTPELRGKLLVECQVDPFLLLLQRKNAEIPLYRYDANADTALTHAIGSGYAGITVQHGRITHKQVQHAQDLGLQVSLFGAGEHWSHWQALRKGPDRLQTDAPEAFGK